MSITNLDFVLTDESKKLFEKLDADEVILLVRRNDFPPYYDAKRSSEYHKKFNFWRNQRVEANLRQLGTEMKSELERMGMIRTDFYESDRFKLSANILALRQIVSEKSSRGLRYYYDSEQYIGRLIRRLNNTTYESWQGYDDETITKIKELLKKTLSDVEYGVISMRFGLEDGKCCNGEEIAQHFGWKSSGGPAHHEKDAYEKLYEVLGELKQLTKIS